MALPGAAQKETPNHELRDLERGKIRRNGLAVQVTSVPAIASKPFDD